MAAVVIPAFINKVNVGNVLKNKLGAGPGGVHADHGALLVAAGSGMRAVCLVKRKRLPHHDG